MNHPCGTLGFDGILRVKLSPVVQLICYSNETLAVCSAETVGEMESRVIQVLKAMTTWIESAGLKLAIEKTEVALSIKRRKFIPAIFRLGEVEMKIDRRLKYPRPMV